MRLDELERQARVLNQPGNQPGTVVALASETGRYTQFYLNFQALGFTLPQGSNIKWLMGSDIAESRNQACEEFTGDWIWFIDDDHSFEPDILARLLARNVDIVTPLCLRRVQPFLAIPCVDDDFMDLSLYGPDDLVEVDHAGASGMLIRRRVLESMGPPWFELGHRQEDGLRISEDVNFCRRARKAGFTVHVDLGARLGHITTAVVWPTFDELEGRWLTGFTIADGANLAIEAGMPNTVVEND